MSEKPFALKRAHILLIVLAGTAVRLGYGLYARDWLAALDQLAWQLTLDAIKDTGFSYASMITYPHEGGSFLVSVLALALGPVAGWMPALSLAGLLLDAGCRLLQIQIADKLFGSAPAGWFGLWTIVSVPLLLPWGTVMFALHPLAAVFPFLLLLVLSGSHPRFAGPLFAGISCAIALSISYDSIVLVPVAVLWFLVKEKNPAASLKFTGALAVGLIPHLLLRTLPDNGFALRGFGLFSIRGVSWQETFTDETLVRFRDTLTTILPGSSFLQASELLSADATNILALVFCVVGLGCCFMRSGRERGVTAAAIGIVLIFVASYSISPFFVKLPVRQNYLYYRHLTFIIPLLALLTFRGFTRFRWTQAIAGLWLATSLFFSVSYVNRPSPVQTPAYLDAGWVLAQKFGERSQMLMSFYGAAPDAYKAQLMKGYGWGLAAALLYYRPSEDTQKVPQLLHLIRQMPAEHQGVLLSGVRHAFSPGPTPRLDPGFLDEIENDLAIAVPSH